MNIRTPGTAFRTADDFLAWNEGREGRREFVDGRVIEMMTGVTQRHWKLGMRLNKLMSAVLDDALYDYGTADFGVLTPRGVRYPDYLVKPAGGRDVDLATHEPLLVAEILSPSSLATDFGTKVAEYLSVPSLRHYVVLSQDEPRAWVWTRGDEGFGEPEMLVGPEASITLGAFDASLSLAELYRGIA
jgi:Uma2 family endonuclease